VTERNRAEARLREAQKLEALGRVAGGVAHDFNNLLQVVTGALWLIQSRPDRPDRVRRYAEAALEAAERGAGVTRRMLAFARQDRLDARPVPLDAALGELRGLLKGPLGPGIALEVAAPPDLPPVQADRVQLDLVLFNLALNARDAMTPDGGTLRIEAAAEETAPEDAAGDAVAPGDPRGLRPGRYVRLTVADTGSGMDAATLARATEPFFTTKEVGRGTGLGLSMAHGFAVQSGGALAIESQPGRGTRVRLWLPAAAAVGTAAAASDPPPLPAPPREGTTVLLVEDEAAVRGVLAAALREAGLSVVEATGAAEARSLLDRGGGAAAFDAVITDHAMPGTTGAVLAADLVRRGGAPPVLVMTGNAEAPLFAVPEGVAVMRKPLDPAALVAWVADRTGAEGPRAAAQQG
jgi:nitrogen-specific signal transduction histidine kinase/CheY-like chemotaxis protein